MLENSQVHVADNTWESVVERRIREMGSELQGRGTNFEAYFKANDLTEEDFMSQLREDAQINVRRAVVIQKLFQDNGMKIEQEDLNEFFRQVLAENNVAQEQVEAFTQQYGAQIREEVVFRAMTSKVTDLLIENADITEGATGSAPKAAKKAASKETKSEDKTTKKSSGATKKSSK